MVEDDVFVSRRWSSAGCVDHSLNRLGLVTPDLVPPVSRAAFDDLKIEKTCNFRVHLSSSLVGPLVKPGGCYYYQIGNRYCEYDYLLLGHGSNVF